MRELMLELLTWAPFEKLVPGEEKYIDGILSGNCNPPPPQAKFHELFSGFYDYYVQREKICEKIKAAKKTRDNKKTKAAKKARADEKIKAAEKDMDDERSKYMSKLRQWNATYFPKGGRAHRPLLFKKICFYLVVMEGFSESDFMAQIGSHVSRIREWKISPEFRKRAEADTYSVIKSYRSGTKRKYLVSLIKRLYYEAGRQVSQSMVLNKLPPFVDVFAGTASVAASVVTDGCPPPIVNELDTVMMSFIWAFTFYQKELSERIAKFHSDMMEDDIESTSRSYNKDDYDRHCKRVDPRNLLTNPEVWDDPVTQQRLMEFFGYSEDEIKGGKELAQRHQELVIRVRSNYIDVKNYLKSRDRDVLRENTDFNKLPKNITFDGHLKEEIDIQVDEILDYALAVFFYYSFPPSGRNVYHETIADVCSYFSYLSRLQTNLSVDRRKNKAEKAKTLLELQLKASLLTLESTGSFSRHLKDAEFYCKDFRDILQNNSEAEGVYYLDSPYFLTVGYDVGFSEEDHKEMLDILRGAEFKWIFSIQYKPSDEGTKTSKKRCRNQPPIIRNYGDYYRGFYAPFRLEADQWICVATDAPMENAKNLYAILFDVKAAKEKGQDIYRYTREILLVNFNPLRTIPLHNSAVVLPFDLFLQYADAGMNYRDIVLKAIDWRRNYIEKNFAGKIPV